MFPFYYLNKKLCIPLCVVLVCVLFSCNNKSNSELKIFRYNQIGGMESLDPAFAKNLSIMWGVHFLYNTLVETDTNLQIVPSLAHSWSADASGLHYTFHIRTDVYFHDNDIFPEGKGRKMTAHDIVYSFQRLIDPQTASPGAWIFNDRVSAENPFEAPNDSTFIIHLSQPFRPLIELLSMPYCSVVPQESIERWGKDFRNHPCGTGAFQFQFWDESNVLVLHKNKHYWEKDDNGNPLPYLDAVQVSFNETRLMEFLLFKQGKIDFINGIDGSVKDLILSKNGTLKTQYQNQFNATKYPYLNTEYIGILLSPEKANPLQQKKIRQAINYAIDKEKIVTYFRNGIGAAADRGFVPPIMPGVSNTALLQQEYNPNRAIALLKEAGYNNANPLPTITLTTPEVYADMCNFIATELKKININANIEIIQPVMLRQLMSNTSVPMFKAMWIADYPDAESFLSVFNSHFPAPPNYTRFANKEYDNLYQQSISTNNDSLRYILYGKMIQIINEELPVIPLFYDEIIHFSQKNIEGLQRNSLNIIDVKRVRKKT